MTRKVPPPGDQKPSAAPFTLSDADITSTRVVSRSRLPGVLGAAAVARAFGNPGGAAASDHDGPADPARPVRQTAQKPAPDGDG